MDSNISVNDSDLQLGISTLQQIRNRQIGLEKLDALLRAAQSAQTVAREAEQRLAHVGKIEAEARERGEKIVAESNAEAGRILAAAEAVQAKADAEARRLAELKSEVAALEAKAEQLRGDVEKRQAELQAIREMARRLA